MDFAISNSGQKIKAFPDGRAFCPNCKSILIAKCGDLNIWHWAHENLLDCDTWHYEPKTKWHIEWQNHFPGNQIEVYLSRDGQAHIADILTSKEVTIEIQNSTISTTEILEREQFYKKMIWVVNSKEFKHHVTLTKFSYDFATEALYRHINPNPTIERAAYAVTVPIDDFDNQIKKALILCKYEKQTDKENDEDDDDDSESIWYNQKTMYNQPLDKEISNAFCSYLLDTKMRYTMDDFIPVPTNFKWKHFRKTWLTANMPIFIDFNNRYMLWIIRLHENGNGFGKVISKKMFLKKYKQ